MWVFIQYSEAVDGELGYVSVWSSNYYLTHLENVTTTLNTTTNEALNYRWNNHRLTASIKEQKLESIGSNIEGEVDGDGSSGMAVALSGDGSIIALEHLKIQPDNGNTHNSGQVRVFVRVPTNTSNAQLDGLN